MVLFSIHHPTCDISHACQEGREVKRPKDLKTSKKSNEPLDTFDNVIYVTRITTEPTTVFVSASACNPSFGQGYAHQLIGEKAMTNSVSANTNLVADENGNINCVNCTDCTDCVDCVDCKNCKNCVGCKDCDDCEDCEECVECSYCTRCYHCDTCENCGNSQWCCGCYNVFDDENCNDEDRSCDDDDEDESVAE